jgi:hypothetical protein
MKVTCSDMIQLFRLRESILEGVGGSIGETLSSDLLLLNPVTRNIQTSYLIIHYLSHGNPKNQLVGLDIDENNIKMNLNEKVWTGLIWLRIRSNTWIV